MSRCLTPLTQQGDGLRPAWFIGVVVLVADILWLLVTRRMLVKRFHHRAKNIRSFLVHRNYGRTKHDGLPILPRKQDR